MLVVAFIVLAAIAAISIWAFRRAPDPLSEIAEMWRLSWGKQIFLDFYGLEAVLLLWMGAHASETGSWLLFGISAVTMPFAGAMSAALYWILAVG